MQSPSVNQAMEILREMRQTTGGQASVQEKLEQIVALIANKMSADAANCYVAIDDYTLELFASYVRVLEKLADDSANREVALRTFELELMEALGYGLPQTGESWYWDGEELKPCKGDEFHTDRHIIVDSNMIDRLHQRDFRSKETLAFAKTLMRRMIAHYAGEKPLNTRRIFEELKRL